MQKIMKKFAKILLLIAVIFSDLMTPISVFAEELASEVNKGDLRLNGLVSDNGSVTVSAGSFTNDGDVLVTKTVSKTSVEGRYKVEFNIKGKEVISSTVVTKPLYVVIVFDRSGSMENTCIESSWGFCTKYDNKWDNAVLGAKEFSNVLLEKIPTSQIALVTFSKTATLSRDFENANLDGANFGSANEGTNLHAGLIEANNLLSDSKIPEDANKYVVVISDGQPTYYIKSNGSVGGRGNSTSKSILDATFEEANNIKSYAEMFSIGYMLPTGSVYNDDIYGNLTAKDILEGVATTDSEEDIKNGISHYLEANPEAIANSFSNIANQISKLKAGTNAILTDNIGSSFEIVSQDGDSYVSDVIPEITEEGTTLSFYIDIDKDSITGWYNTNAGFNLKYTDYQGMERTISSDINPEVYWIQNEYNYVVNYYKDSFSDTNLLASDTREATNGTVINEDNVIKDKYLPLGYEFNSLSPESITVTNDGSTKVIDVLYTKKKFDYVVNYYYDGVLDNTNKVSDIEYGTKVDSTTYYLQDSEIKEGYSLDTVNSDKNSYTITDNGVVINIYYKKNSYNYTVKYYFNNNIDTDFTKNNNALYGTTIKASDNYLKDSEKGELYKDYFLDPTVEENTETKVIGTGINELNLYYINTVSILESINKTTTVSKITSSNDVIDYKVVYNSTTLNVRNGDVVTVVITDTLPYEIDLLNENTNLNGGIYDSLTNTITWTYEEEVQEFTREYNVSKEVNYTVVYKDFASLSSKVNNELVNSAKGTTTVAGKTTIGSEAKAIIPVEILGTLTVNYKDLEGNTLAISILNEGLVGSSYETNQKAVYGYTFSHTEGDATFGKYIDGDLTVTYYYTKNSGEVVENKVTKEGSEMVTSVSDTFDYKLTYKGEIDSYKGTATLKLTDNLPYEIDLEKSTFDNRCVYNSEAKEIVCTEKYTLDENVKTINEEFDLSLVFKNVDKDVVVNIVKSELTFDNNKVTDEDKIETAVEKGKVTAIYVDESDTNLSNSETSTGLIGSRYEAKAKDIYGYTLKNVPTNQNGTYTKEDIIVKYVYAKNSGEVVENKVTKEGPEKVTNTDGKFDYKLTYKGEIDSYKGTATLKLTDILPYEIDLEKSTFDNRCVYNSETKEIVCIENYTLDEDVKNISEEFVLSLVFKNVDKDVVVNNVKSELTFDNNKVTDEDKTETEVEKGSVVATYKDTEGNILHIDVKTTGLSGNSYTTYEKEFYGYTLKEVSSNKEGVYAANQTITVNYVYSKNNGTSKDELSKSGNTVVESIDSKFDYIITYNTTINDYVGKVKLIITDILPYEIDLEKSIFSENCKYVDGKLICTYDDIIIDEENRNINIEENFSLYYIGVDSNKVLNRVESVLEHGEIIKTNNDEFETKVLEGKVTVNYVTIVNGEYVRLTDSLEFNGLVGESYTTLQKEFDKYDFAYVVGNRDGEYSLEDAEVTYVYNLTVVPLPPQTGLEVNFIPFEYVLSFLLLFILRKTYKNLKNN